MRINIRGGREIAVSQPLLNHLHRDTVCQKQTGARVAQIVKADAPQMIIPQDNLERIGEIIRLEQIAHCVYADVVCVFFVVAPTAQLAVFFLFLLQGQQPFPENRYKRQGALAGFSFVPLDSTSTSFPSSRTVVTVWQISMVFCPKSTAAHFSPTTSLRRRP